MVDAQTQVPLEFVKNNEIVLNISFSATSGLKMGNDLIHFHARFAGVSREISIPVDNVVAIYARENGQGMAFEVTRKQASAESTDATPPAEAPALSAVPTPMAAEGESKADDTPDDHPDPPKKGGRPTLTRIK
jgi:stringent starvation protein B